MDHGFSCCLPGCNAFHSDRVFAWKVTLLGESSQTIYRTSRILEKERRSFCPLITMNNKAKLTIFILCVVLGLCLQSLLGVRCRCCYGDWSFQFIEGALVFDIMFLGHTVALLVTSVFWIPLIFKAITAIYFLYSYGKVGELGP